MEKEILIKKLNEHLEKNLSCSRIKDIKLSNVYNFDDNKKLLKAYCNSELNTNVLVAPMITKSGKIFYGSIAE